MPNKNEDSAPAGVEDIPLSELCKIEALIAGTVTKNIRVFTERVLDCLTVEGAEIEITYCTAIFLALFKAHGVSLDTPVVSTDIVLPMIDEIANDLGLRGCKSTIVKGVANARN